NTNGPLILVKGQGSTVVDVDGKEYIDCSAGLWCVNVGHGRAELAEAAAEQIRNLGYASGYAGTSNLPAIQLAERLAALAPGDLKATFFTTGGAESSETAFKIARFYWKAKGKFNKVKIISRQKGYHGTTGAAMSATGMSQYWHNFDPLQPGFLHIPTHYCFRCALHKRYPECGVACADILEQLILAEDPDTVAAFMAEPVHGGGGVIVPPPEYFPKVREICNKYDVLFIADEVITGFGRTGKWFGVEQWNVVPDILDFAKGVTSGYQPLGGVMVNERVHKVFKELPAGASFNHAYTYSLHPVCCAVALKNLDIIEGEGLVARAGAMGERLMAGLKQLESLPGVGEVRGLGLMAGIELAADKAGTPLPAATEKKIIDYALDHGLLLRHRGGVIWVSPPLVIKPEEVDRIVNTLGDAIKSVA
ncbi:MAG: aspartate aminotransferase family protein, partial [Chloroflexota bacterium]